jgi:hypothetical protein
LNVYIINRSDFLHENADMAQLKASEKTTLIFIAIAFAALALSFVAPRWGNLVYLLIFPLEMLIER